MTGQKITGNVPKNAVIGVFFGGKSPEHDISIITGALIINGLKRLGYAVVPVYYDKESKPHIGEEFGDLAAFKKGDITGTPTPWTMDLNAPKGKMIFKKSGILGNAVTIDLAFPAFHGENGEDGASQGMFEMCGVPYVGCGIAASALAMDKVLTKQLYETMGFPTAKFIYFGKNDWSKKREDFITKINTGLAWPLFVKPARLGSSIGIAKAHNQKELSFALDVAFHYDEKAIVEEAVPKALDITCCVIGNRAPQASLLQEASFREGFFSYEEKYLSEGGAQFGKAQSKLFIPARVDEATAAAIRNLAIQVFTKFECAGIARVDFLVQPETKKIYVNEINPLPGTLYHHLWEKSGVPFPELLERLLACALERHREKNALRRSFASTVLTHADWSSKFGKRHE
jgi:D-alanine-D-alanine ligase